MGLIPEEAPERRVAAESAVRQRPDDPAAWIALSQACEVLVDQDRMIAAARRAVELQPRNIDAIRQLAGSLFQTGPGQVEARALFEELLVLAPSDPVALHYLHHFAMLDGDYRRAIDFSERLERVQPGSPNTAARIARAFKLMGQPAEAAKHFARAAARCDDEQLPFPDGPMAHLKPVFTALAGNNALAEKLSVELCQESGLGLADLSHPRYPDDCAESISRLEDRVAGRDLFIFGNGPSLADITSRPADVAALDFASMTMSSFPIVEDALLRPIGRRADLACMTHPAVVQQLVPAIREWFGAVPSSILILPLWVREHAALAGGLEFLLGTSDHLFWFDCFSELPPSPTDPLHFPAINTLLCALGVGMLARPRRIFLFGFDGQIQGHDPQRPGALYYGEHHQSYFAPRRHEPEMRRYTQTSLWWDSLLFNEMAPSVLRYVALLFDLPQPPIYNVCVDSAVTSFPRITFERFREIVSREDLRP